MNQFAARNQPAMGWLMSSTQNCAVAVIENYLKQIQALGVRADGGEKVLEEVITSVGSATTHLTGLRDGTDPEANLRHYEGQLRFAADHLFERQPHARTVVLFAAELAKRKLAALPARANGVAH